MPSPRRSVTVLAFSLALALGACDKGKGTTPPPDGAGDQGDGGAGKTDAVTLRYSAEPRALHQTGVFETSQTGGGQFTEAKIEFAADLVIDKDADKLKVVWDLQSVDKLELGGALEPKEGEDPKAYLVEKGKGAYLTDLRGESDGEASEALPENAESRAEAEKVQQEMQSQAAAGKQPELPVGPIVLQFLPRAFQLPTLPEQPLEVGKAVTIEKSEEEVLGQTGIVLPLDIETTYTLVKIDDSGGSRIAEIQHTGEAGGATETQMGMITLAASYEGTLLFDLDTQVPVSYERQSTESFELGQLGTQEQTLLLRSEWAKK